MLRLQLERAPWPGKPGRCLYRLGPVPDAAYAAAVATVAPAIEGALHPWVVGNRVERYSPLGLEGLGGARARYRALVASHASRSGAALRLDVRDCFRSIAPSAVGECLSAIGAPGSASGRVVAQLEVLGAHGVIGLPVGPVASAVLANAVLAVSDRAIGSLPVLWARWVDDVVLFGESSELRAAELAIAAALTRSGLTLHPEKRAWSRGGDAALALALRRPSAATLGRHAHRLPGAARPHARRDPGIVDPRRRPPHRPDGGR